MFYFYPDIFEQFQCAMCGACCRNDWMVTLDHTSYQRNEAYFSQNGRNHEFQQAFRQIASTSLGEYAHIAKQPNGNCWFLASNNLCRLHREAGHEHLDAVCQTFPRYPMDTERGVELTLSFSCPTVLELASRSLINIVRSETIPAHLCSDNFVTTIYPHQYPINHLNRYYFEIEQHFIDILQWRSQRMEDRVQLIGKTVERLAKVDQPNLGSRLTYITRENYEIMDRDCHADRLPDASDTLIENYLVNFVFKKVFYIHGMRGGAELLNLLWSHINSAKANQEDGYERIRAAILELDFEYSHHRSRFLSRLEK